MDTCAELLAVEFVFGVGGVPFETIREGLIGVALFGFEGDVVTVALAAQGVDTDVVCDAIGPRRKGGTAAKVFEIVVDAKKGFLEEFFGDGGLSYHAEDVVVEGALVALEEFCEGASIVVLTGGFNEVEVGQGRIVGHRYPRSHREKESPRRRWGYVIYAESFAGV